MFDDFADGVAEITHEDLPARGEDIFDVFLGEGELMGVEYI